MELNEYVEQRIKEGTLIFVNSPSFYWDTTNKKVIDIPIEPINTKSKVEVKTCFMRSCYIPNKDLFKWFEKHKDEHLIMMKFSTGDILFPDSTVRVYFN